MTTIQATGRETAATGQAPAVKTSRNASAAKLSRAIAASDKRLQPFRDNRRKLISDFCGPYYGDNKPSDDRLPINLLFSLVSTIVPNLAIDPRVLVTPARLDLKPFSRKLEAAMNHWLGEMSLGLTFLRVLTDAMFGVGIVKLGHCVRGDYGPGEPDAVAHDPAQPFCDPVSLDNYILDPRCRHREEAAFEGDTEEVLYEYALSSGLYDKELLQQYKGRMDEARRQKAKDISSEQQPADDPLYETIWLPHVWLPHEGVVVTLPGGEGSQPTKYLSEVEWTGHERGPYETFWFTEVPDNSMPLAIAPVVYEMQALINLLSNQIGKQAKDAKRVLVTKPMGEKTGELIQNAGDGQQIMGDASNSQMFEWPGPDPRSFATVNWFMEFFNRVSGNLDILGGLSSQSGTLGQDQMLNANATIRISHWRQQMMTSARWVMQKLAFEFWHDPGSKFHFVNRNGPDEEDVVWNPDRREGDFLEYGFDIAPYQLRHDSPEQQYNRMVDWLTRVYIPLAQIGAPQGYQADVAAVVEETGRMLQIPNVSQFFWKGPKTQPPEVTAAAGQPDQAGQSVGIVRRQVSSRPGIEDMEPAEPPQRQNQAPAPAPVPAARRAAKQGAIENG